MASCLACRSSSWICLEVYPESPALVAAPGLGARARGAPEQAFCRTRSSFEPDPGVRASQRSSFTTRARRPWARTPFRLATLAEGAPSRAPRLAPGLGRPNPRTEARSEGLHFARAVVERASAATCFHTTRRAALTAPATGDASGRRLQPTLSKKSTRCFAGAVGGADERLGLRQAPASGTRARLRGECSSQPGTQSSRPLASLSSARRAPR